MSAGAHAEVRTRMRVSRLLDSADMEPAGFPGGAILVVRSLGDPLPGCLRTDARSLRAPAEWEGAVRAALTDCWRGAARPERGAVPAGAGAVLFADVAELLSAFARDVGAGVARSSWWWAALLRDAAREPTAALIALWTREARHVPAALALLAQRGDAARVVGGWAPAQARRLLAAVTEAHGLPHLVAPAPPAAGMPRTAAPGSSPEVGRHGASAPPFGAARADAPIPGGEGRSAPWESLVPASAVPVTLAPDARALLGIGLALHRAPLAVRTAGFAAAFSHWRETVATHYISNERTIQSVPTADPFGAVAPRATARGNISEGTSLGEAASSSGDAGPAGAGRLHHAALRTAGAPPWVDVLPAGPPRSSVSPPVPAAEPAFAGYASSTDPAGLGMPGAAAGNVSGSTVHSHLVEAGRGGILIDAHSALCGVFFLINALRALEWFARVPGHASGTPLASGWAWIELVARRLLGRRSCSDDPVWRVLAALDGREPWDPVPRPDSFDPFLRQAFPPFRRRLIGALRGAGSREPVRAALLRRSGVIQATRTHVDVRMGLEQVTIPVRLAGLDANPGWVPELARVVTFHFD